MLRIWQTRDNWLWIDPVGEDVFADNVKICDSTLLIEICITPAGLWWDSSSLQPGWKVGLHRIFYMINENAGYQIKWNKRKSVITSLFLWLNEI